MKVTILILCTLTLLLNACANKEFKDQFDSEKTWTELEAQLPEYPEQSDLLPFDSGPASNNQYFIDASSILVGSDGVIRYTLAVKSPSGAMNVTFEGLRCRTNERKLYALGHDNGEWAHSRNPDWQPIENISQYNAQQELAKYYFCPLRSIVKTPKEAISALKAGIHPRVKMLYQ